MKNKIWEIVIKISVIGGRTAYYELARHLLSHQMLM